MTLSAQLGLLEGSGLIQLAAIQPELEYLFRHVLVKEAAYHSLVKSDRRALHHAVAETLEALYSSSEPVPGQLYPLLAFHFAGAGEDARAQHYFTLAGDVAAATYANLEAAAHFTQALEAATAAGAPAPELIDLHTRLGRVYELSGNYTGALDTYAQLETAGERVGDQRMVLAAITLQAVIRSVPSAAIDPTQADQLTQRALALARALGDQAAEARALWVRMLYELLIGHSREAVQAGEAGLALARELGLNEQIGLLLTDIGRAYAGAGQIEQSHNVQSEAAQIWRALGNQPMLAESLNDEAATQYFVGEYSTALTLLDDAFAVSTAAGNAWGQAYGLMLRSFLLLEVGSIQDALESIQASLSLADAGGFVAPLVETRCALALVLANVGQFERAKAEVQAARQTLGGQTSSVLTSVVAVDAHVHLLAGDLAAAEALLAEAHAQPGKADLTSYAPLFEVLTDAGLGLAHGDYQRVMAATGALLDTTRKLNFYAFRIDLELAQARGLIGLGRLDEASAVLAEAQREAETKHIRRLLWEVLAVRADMAERQGQPKAAAQLRRRARSELEGLAAQLVDPVFRAGLLQQPAARALLAAAPPLAGGAP